MDAMDAILSRRSIRQYTSQPVPEEMVKVLLEAGMSAPSAGNQQPWRFVVLTDREMLDAITTFHPYSGMLKEAPLAILVCGDLEVEQHEGFWVQDCSAATENILLAAHAHGLGAVWLGVHPVPDLVAQMRELVGAPEQVVPLCLISIGHPAEQKPRADRYEEERVHRERW